MVKAVRRRFQTCGPGHQLKGPRAVTGSPKEVETGKGWLRAGVDEPEALTKLNAILTAQSLLARPTGRHASACCSRRPAQVGPPLLTAMDTIAGPREKLESRDNLLSAAP